MSPRWRIKASSEDIQRQLPPLFELLHSTRSIDVFLAWSQTEVLVAFAQVDLASELLKSADDIQRAAIAARMSKNCPLGLWPLDESRLEVLNSPVLAFLIAVVTSPLLSWAAHSTEIVSCCVRECIVRVGEEETHLCLSSALKRLAIQRMHRNKMHFDPHDMVDKDGRSSILAKTGSSFIGDNITSSESLRVDGNPLQYRCDSTQLSNSDTEHSTSAVLEDIEKSTTEFPLLFDTLAIVFLRHIQPFSSTMGSEIDRERSKQATSEIVGGSPKIAQEIETKTVEMSIVKTDSFYANTFPDSVLAALASQLDDETTFLTFARALSISATSLLKTLLLEHRNHAHIMSTLTNLLECTRSQQLWELFVRRIEDDVWPLAAQFDGALLLSIASVCPTMFIPRLKSKISEIDLQLQSLDDEDLALTKWRVAYLASGCKERRELNERVASMYEVHPP